MCFVVVVGVAFVVICIILWRKCIGKFSKLCGGLNEVEVFFFGIEKWKIVN